jgi:hypothetical protein
MGFDTDPYNDFGRLRRNLARIRWWSTPAFTQGLDAEAAEGVPRQLAPAGAGGEIRDRALYPQAGRTTSYKIGMIDQKLRDEAEAGRIRLSRRHTVLGGGLCRCRAAGESASLDRSAENCGGEIELT